MKVLKWPKGIWQTSLDTIRQGFALARVDNYGDKQPFSSNITWRLSDGIYPTNQDVSPGYCYLIILVNYVVWIGVSLVLAGNSYSFVIVTDRSLTTDFKYNGYIQSYYGRMSQKYFTRCLVCFFNAFWIPTWYRPVGSMQFIPFEKTKT